MLFAARIETHATQPGLDTPRQNRAGLLDQRCLRGLSRAARLSPPVSKPIGHFAHRRWVSIRPAKTGLGYSTSAFLRFSKSFLANSGNASKSPRINASRFFLPQP